MKKVCWNIPLSYLSRKRFKFFEDDTDISLPKWLTCEKSETFKINLVSEEWMIVNPKLHGMYYNTYKLKQFYYSFISMRIYYGQ